MLIDGLTALVLVATSFAATNFDNLALLVSWLLAQVASPGRILLAHLLGMLALIVLAFAFGLGAELFPIDAIGYLGLIPILMGTRGLYGLLRRDGSTPASIEGAGQGSVVLSIATTQVANGVDTVLVFGPLFADSRRVLDVLLLAGFAGMALLWFGLARLLTRSAARLPFLERSAQWMAPLFLIAIGVYILLDTRSDVAPG